MIGLRRVATWHTALSERYLVAFISSTYVPPASMFT
jgi:hypothetical protein